MRLLQTTTALCLLSLNLFAQNAASPPAIDRAADLIREQDIRADITFLASDALAGRNSTSHEDRIATDFIASEFLRLGLKPIGDNGTYFQEMEILTGNVDHGHTTLEATIGGTKKAFAFGSDFQTVRQSIRNTNSCGRLVFAGYGIDAPEYGYNDFANIDVKGKIAIIFLREPQANDPSAKMMGTLDSYHAFNWQKLEELRRRGAAGLLIVQDRVPRNVKPIPPTSPRPAVTTSYALAGEMWDIPTFLVKRDVADQLLSPGGKTADTLQAAIDHSLQPQSFDLPQGSACLNKAFTEIESHKGRNVVAMLEGSDPRLKAETIILTAHHDHMGESGGHIYHGADDNASGVSGILSVARALTLGNIHPKRSILFISYDAEERIFLGSYFYVTHPLIPLARTVATINLDMIGRDENDANWPVPPDQNRNMVNVLGTRYNPGLRAVIDRENKPEHLKLDYKMDTVDPDSLWSRSDHFWFAPLHIPQVEFQTGLHPDYHTENDTADRINYPKTTRIDRLVFRSVVDIANAPNRIAFVPAGAPLPSQHP
ncbi:MAG: M28 family peptidase [Edaphobacter sp.]|uniref:M28 family peptidase n=1 Tax=Edaphobacter sp. TaxID=1934404 RepID=UPI0023A48A62|nr:M28 family peptidase [Edaphobacter sp.]MDE1176232.1 M28 family peptidase [Edaphobacter sp.]